MSANQERDAYYMARAIRLAQNGRYTTAPNPRVGCVIVRDEHILGEGWHAWAGTDHAEIVALKNAGDVCGATVYVTLEPCCHHGKTPPCANALIEAGVARVVAAMPDPNPLVAGNGFTALQKAGINVEVGLLQSEAEALNPGFIRRMTSKRPYFRSKLAMSLDGRTALASGESRWITSDQARRDVHRLRAASSAILTGIGTILADDPSLSARVDFDAIQPIRIVLDSNLKTPPSAKMAALPGRTLILTCSDDEAKQTTLRQNGFEVYRLPNNTEGQLSLDNILTFLTDQQINEVLVEAGAVLNGALLNAGLIDELIVYLAPCLLGDQGRGLFHLPAITTMNDKKNLTLIDSRRVGVDLKLTFKPTTF